jgi:Protein of unknown function DUF262
MKLFEPQNTTLSSLIDNITNGSYLIPEFQRSFVWKDSDIEKLGTQLIRGGTIGPALLLSDTSGSIWLQSTPLSTSAVKPAGQLTQVSYVLDGQQRLTSIAEIFGATKREYFFDTLAILLHAFGDSVSTSQRFAASALVDEVDAKKLCYGFPMDRNTHVARGDGRFISARSAITGFDADVTKTFLDSFDDVDESLRKTWFNYITRSFDDLANYPIFINRFKPNAQIDDVLTEFEMVNSTGTKLTVYNLIHSKSFKVTKTEWKCGLTAFLTQEIQNRRKESTPNAIKLFLGETKSRNGQIHFDELIRFLKCVSYAESYVAPYTLGNKDTDRKTGSYPTVGSIFKQDPESWFKQWNKHSANFLRFIGNLEKVGVFDFGNFSFIEPIIGIALCHPALVNDDRFLEAIKKKVLHYAVNSKTTFRRSDLGILKDFIDYGLTLLSSKGLDRHSNHKVWTDMEVIRLTPCDFSSVGMKTHKSRALLHIIYNEKPQGVGLHDLTGRRIDRVSSDAFDYHHIFPQATTKTLSDADRRLCSSVANAAVLNKKSNRDEIKDKRPCVYLTELRKHYKHAKDFERQNLLEDFIAVKEGDEAFALAKRLQKMVDVANDYFKQHATFEDHIASPDTFVLTA